MAPGRRLPPAIWYEAAIDDLSQSVRANIRKRAPELVVVATASIGLAAAVRQLANEAEKPCLVVSRRLLSAVLETMRSLGVVGTESWTEAAAGGFTILGVRATETLAEYGLIFATSGSTGHPKLVPFRNAQVEFVTAAIAERLRYDQSDVVGCAMYPFFDYGFYQADLAAQVGATVRQFDGIRFPMTALEHIRDDRVTVLPVTPAYAKRLAFVAEELSVTFPDVRMVTNTGANLSANLRLRLESVFPNAVVRTMYGLTECKRVSVSTEADAAIRTAHCGTPLSGTTVTVRGPEGDALPPFAVGEIWVAGPHVTDGYLGGPRTNGLLRTGDLGMLDEAGRIQHAGRIESDQVKLNDERISVAAIEEAALKVLPSDALVLAVPSSDQDDITNLVTLYVTPATGTPEQVLSSIRQHVGGGIARIVHVIQGAPLGVSENGKVRIVHDD